MVLPWEWHLPILRVHTYLMPDVPPPADDCVLLPALRRVAADGKPGRRHRRIGISGPDGRVYRVLAYDPAREHGALAVTLHRLGFVAEPCEVGMTIFRRGPRSPELARGR